MYWRLERRLRTNRSRCSLLATAAADDNAAAAAAAADEDADAISVNERYLGVVKQNDMDGVKRVSEYVG